METSAQGISVPSAVYEIAGRRFEVGARGFADAVADAHAAHQRPRCMCLVEGVEMYVARLGEGTVRRHLLQAAERKFALGQPLRTRLYIPEVFSVEQRDAINARRLSQWAGAVSTPGKVQQLMLMICEVKEIAPARYGFKAVVKHLPDQAFAIDEQLYRRLARRFEPELDLWGVSDSTRMVMISTFRLNTVGLPSIVELSLMPVTLSWLPIDDAFDKQLVEHLEADGRTFVKGLRYNMAARCKLASATLTDCGDLTPLLFIVRANSEDCEAADVDLAPSGLTWCWNPTTEQMPPLPPRSESRQGRPAHSTAG